MHRSFRGRRAVLASTAALAATLALPAAAQAPVWPAKPVKIARLDGLDLHYEGLTGAAASKRLSDLSDRYGKVIRATGMKVE